MRTKTKTMRPATNLHVLVSCPKAPTSCPCSLPLFFFRLRNQVPLVSDFLDLMHLRFKPVDVSLFIFEQPHEQIAGAVVAFSTHTRIDSL